MDILPHTGPAYRLACGRRLRLAKLASVLFSQPRQRLADVYVVMAGLISAVSLLRTFVARQGSITVGAVSYGLRNLKVFLTF